MRTKLVAVAAAAAFAVALTPSPASAAAQVGLAVPGSALGGYATPVIVVTKGAPFTFVNADPVGPGLHDIVSRAPGTIRSRYLFASRLIPGGATSEVDGMQNTETGQVYEFFCSAHPAAMTGTLVVI